MSVKKQKPNFVTESHIHEWGPAFDLVERRCKCGGIMISNNEWVSRQEEWDNYYALCLESKAHQDYVEMRIAFKQKDQERIKEILKSVTKRMWPTEDKDEWGETIYGVDKEAYMTRPHHPDPRRFVYTIAN